MKKYNIPYTHYITIDVIVEAEDENEAIKKAKIKLNSNRGVINKAINNAEIVDDIYATGGEDFDLVEDEIFEIK